jgi:hypothetical protein
VALNLTLESGEIELGWKDLFENLRVLSGVGTKVWELVKNFYAAG